MTRKEALELLDQPGDDEDAILDALDDKLFTIKKEVQSKYMVPLLMEKQLKVLDLLRDAWALLLDAELLPLPEEAPLAALPFTDAITFLSAYEHLRASCLLEISKAKNPIQLRRGILHLKELQMSYMEGFNAVFPQPTLSEDQLATSSRDMVDTGVLLRLLKQGDATDVPVLKEKKRIQLLQSMHHS